MAYKIIRPESREAWLQEREKGIGSSEATTLMGVNHYEDRYRLFMRKTHQMEPKPASEQMELGHHLEPAVASRFAELTGAWIDPKSEGDWIAVDTKKDYLRVSPDRIWVPAGEEHKKENWRILECKTTGMSVDPDDIPSYWYCQLQYQMGVMGIKKGAVAWISSFPVFNRVWPPSRRTWRISGSSTPVRTRPPRGRTSSPRTGCRPTTMNSSV